MEEMDINENPLVGEICPNCGQPTWAHDKEQKHYVCVNGECGWVEDDAGDSIMTRLTRLLRRKSE